MNGMSFFGLIILLGGACLCGVIEFYCDFYQTCGILSSALFFGAFIIAAIGFILLLIGTLIERQYRGRDFEENDDL